MSNVAERVESRLAAAGGAIFAVLYAVGFVLHGLASGTSNDETRGEVVARYADEGNEALVHVGGLLIGFAIVFLLLFLGQLRRALRRVEGAGAALSTAAFAGGVLLAGLAATSAAVGIAAYSSADFYDAYRVDPDVVLLMETLSFTALGYALVGGAVLVGATSVVALRTRLFPRWLALAGLVLAAVCAFGEWALFVPFPLAALLLWLLVTSVLLVARQPGARPAGLEVLARREEQPA